MQLILPPKDEFRRTDLAIQTYLPTIIAHYPAFGIINFICYNSLNFKYYHKK
jgi:hypothetical protein